MRRRSTYDVIVVGLGTMGSATAYHLARRGARVLGLEQFDIVHERGSMHGGTRLIRLAYHEDARYVSLLRRAYELWRELEGVTGRRLLHVCGSLDLGREDGTLVAGALRACHEHSLPYELLTPAEVERRSPTWRLPTGIVGLLQPDGGFLAAEPSVRAHANAAAAAGAELSEQEAVLDWEPTRDGVSVRTPRGVYAAGRLVLCPGAWAPRLLRLPDELLTVERQVVAWFDAAYSPDLFPVFIAEDDANYYGTPAYDGRGIKIGRMHHPGTAVDPESNGAVEAHEVEAIERFARAWLPGAGRPVQATACLFTMTPDRNFVIDVHPVAPNVVVASACSGHGFKFAPVIGEILADLALVGDTEHPIDFLRLRPSRLGDEAREESESNP